MLESLSLPGGVTMPRLRWARKEARERGEQATPSTAAHLAVAFDTFESRVVADVDGRVGLYPIHAFGLMAFYERQYKSLPSPMWRNGIPTPTEGEKHPARRGYTEMLVRLQEAIQSVVVRHVGADGGRLFLETAITPEKDQGLRELHRLCDWVVTLDRNAGIEYFDSPQDNKDVYDAYVIDCVPEREDLGCLQLTTSTANLDEVRGLLDPALDQMGLARSRRNAEFLLENLKALSGRFAIRLTGQTPATSELVALAISHANCRLARADESCWVSLDEGFLVPVDDVRDILPPLEEKDVDQSRPDLIYISLRPRFGLTFEFIEVKYRRDLRSARSLDVLNRIRERTHALRRRWEEWYGTDVCAPFRAIRRAKLARVLRFYADKARRHRLPEEKYQELAAEIHKMVAHGGSYSFGEVAAHRGWIFCPEYVPHAPMEISPSDWTPRVYLAGPSVLPDLSANSAGIAPHVSAEIAADRRVRSHAPARASGLQPSASVPAGVDSVPKEPSINLGLDRFSDASVEWKLDISGNPHLLVAGLPGMGKTTTLVNMCKQMVAAGVRPIVFSYHEDIDAGLAGRSAGSLRFVDFEGLGFNPLRIQRERSKTAYLDVAGTIRDIFSAIFPELGDIQGDRIRRAIKGSFEEKGWKEAESDEVPAFRRFLEILQADPKPDRGLRGLLARLEELDDYGFFGPTSDQASLWDTDGPIVVRVHATQNDTLQRAFASFVFYRLYKDMFLRGIQERITHAIIFDEAHRAARLKLLPTMAKECRKYGISLVVASQQASDFNTSLFSAIANYLILRLTDADARFLARNVASSHQEKILIDRIKGMDRFKAVFFAEGDGIPRSIALHPEEEGRVVAAIRRYLRGGISTGGAAEWAGIPKTVFLMKLGEHGIDTFDMSGEEFRNELDSGRRFL